jgi:hypothetical protein
MQNNRRGVDELANYCSTNQTVAFGGLNADIIDPYFNYDYGVLFGTPDAAASI